MRVGMQEGSYGRAVGVPIREFNGGGLSAEHWCGCTVWVYDVGGCRRVCMVGSGTLCEVWREGFMLCLLGVFGTCGFWICR